MLDIIKRFLKSCRAEKKLRKTLKELEASKITPNEARRRFGLPEIETEKTFIESEDKTDVE
jgi:hypothetical protein